MCLQCLPFFSKSRGSPPSSPRHGSSHKSSTRPAQEPPSLEQPLPAPSADPSYETASSLQESFSSSQTSLSVEPSYSTPQFAVSVEPLSTTSQTAHALTDTEAVPMEPFFTPLTGPQESSAESPLSTTPQEPLQTAHDLADTAAGPMEPFLTPVADPPQEYYAEVPTESTSVKEHESPAPEVDESHAEAPTESKEEVDESHAEVPTESTSVEEHESAAPEVDESHAKAPTEFKEEVDESHAEVEVPTESTSVEEHESAVPEVSSLEGPLQDFEFPEGLQGVPLTPAPIGDSLLSDVPEPTSLATSQSAPNLEVKQTDENDPQFVPSTTSVIANLESAQSDPTLEEVALPGFADALPPLEDHHHRHHRFRRHFQGLLKEGEHVLKEGKHILRDEGSRHFQSLFNNTKN